MRGSEATGWGGERACEERKFESVEGGCWMNSGGWRLVGEGEPGVRLSRGWGGERACGEQKVGSVEGGCWMNSGGWRLEGEGELG